MENSIRPDVAVLQELWRKREAPIEGEEMIEVSAATRRIAGAYEQFRNTLEPEEADILRRGSIVRMLDRRLKQDRSAHLAAIALIQELIRANYIPPVPKKVAGPVAQDIERTRFILDRLELSYHAWFLRIVAVSIDRRLHAHDKPNALLNLLYQDTFQRTNWLGDMVEAGEQASQLFIACARVLLEADDAEISYTYFISQFPAWEKTDATEAEIIHVAVHLPAFYATAKALVEHPARHRLMRLLRPASVPYRILSDIVPDLDQLDAKVQQAMASRTTSIQVRMRRRTWHSILFLLFTKTILTGLLEYPYELFVLRQVHWGALGINLIFHPTLLLATSFFLSLPGRANTEKITAQIRRLVTGEGELPTVVLAPARHYGPITWSGFAVLYTILFLVIFWGLFSLLDLLQFSLVGMFLFVVFLGLVVFLAFRVRRAVDEIRLEPEREGLVATLFSFIGLPILEFGRWLARNIRQINVMLFFMDRVLEAPFKVAIDVIEDWFSFVRDRKEEIV